MLGFVLLVLAAQLTHDHLCLFRIDQPPGAALLGLSRKMGPKDVAHPLRVDAKEGPDLHRRVRARLELDRRLLILADELGELGDDGGPIRRVPGWVNTQQERCRKSKPTRRRREDARGKEVKGILELRHVKSV